MELYRLSGGEYAQELENLIHLAAMHQVIASQGDAGESLAPAVCASGALEAAIALYRHHTDLRTKHPETVMDASAVAGFLEEARAWMGRLEGYAEGHEEELTHLGIMTPAEVRYRFPMVPWDQSHE